MTNKTNIHRITELFSWYLRSLPIEAILWFYDTITTYRRVDWLWLFLFLYPCKDKKKKKRPSPGQSRKWPELRHWNERGCTESIGKTYWPGQLWVITSTRIPGECLMVFRERALRECPLGRSHDINRDNRCNLSDKY